MNLYEVDALLDADLVQRWPAVDLDTINGWLVAVDPSATLG